MNRIRACIAACAVVAVGLAAGCGGSGSDSDADELDSPTSSTSTLTPNDAQTFTGPEDESNEAPTSPSGGTSAP
jgi:hypothetical protein